MAASSDAPAATEREFLLMLRLALGAQENPSSTLDWEGVLRGAAAERCAMLAWLRSAPIIRSAAPATTVAHWRACAALAMSTTDRRRRQLAALLDVFDRAGVSPVVIKGLPLAAVLYGNASARPVSDTDVFLPLHQRDAAHAALTDAGWVRLYGGRRTEETYRRVTDNDPEFLELHSSLLDENMLQHLRAPCPEAALVNVDGLHVVAHCGASLPVFLAVHLAKHPRVPLLWWIDFATAWNRLPDGDRFAARFIATQHRLDRFLNWAIEGARDIADIADGEDEGAGLAALVRLRTRHARHPVTRIGRLSSTGRDSARVYLAWAFPRGERTRPITLARRTISRGLQWTHMQLGRKRTRAVGG